MDRPQGGAQIGYYEAPDGENEALFAADYIAKYLRQAASENGETPRAAVLYRTNSQSRLLEEAMRRYRLNYHVVGGFSFYERAEIKDMISYLKVIHNPDDSIALQRVINTPTRGIGKNTMETIERIALETGTSMWGAIDEVLRRKLLPPRALAALKSFTELIEDARAMHLGTLPRAGERSIRARTQAAAEHHASGGEPKKMTCSTTSISRRAEFEAATTRRSFAPETFADDGRRRATPQVLTQQARSAVEGFRAPGDPASHGRAAEVPDRPHRLHQAAGAGGHARGAGPHREPARAGECGHGLARPRRDVNEFLDHAALVSDADQYDETARVTLMTCTRPRDWSFRWSF